MHQKEKEKNKERNDIRKVLKNKMHEKEDIQKEKVERRNK